MLSWWIDNIEEKKWATVFQALVKSGLRRLAHDIALKYGTPSANFYLNIPDPSVSQGKRHDPVTMQAASSVSDAQILLMQ